jgi:hypothetical protein
MMKNGGKSHETLVGALASPKLANNTGNLSLTIYMESHSSGYVRAALEVMVQK